MKRIFSLLIAFSIVATMLLCAVGTASATELKIGIGTVEAEGGLYLRARADASSSAICSAEQDDKVIVIREVDGWYLVNYNLYIGYMSSEYVSFAETEDVALGKGTVDPYQANARKAPTQDSEITATLSMGDTVLVLGMSDGWYKIKCQYGVAYLRSDLLTLTSKPLNNSGFEAPADYGRAAEPDTASGSESSGSTGSSSNTGSSGSSGSSSESSLGQQIVTYALSYVGCPYVYGGTSPSGFDCSGFVQYVYKHFGYSLNRGATSQLADGYWVSYDSLMPGDIIYFGYGSTASHVGIYIGGGRFVHAENYSTGVVVTSLSESYYASRYLCAHRIVG